MTVNDYGDYGIDENGNELTENMEPILNSKGTSDRWKSIALQDSLCDRSGTSIIINNEDSEPTGTTGSVTTNKDTSNSTDTTAKKQSTTSGYFSAIKYLCRDFFFQNWSFNSLCLPIIFPFIKEYAQINWQWKHLYNNNNKRQCFQESQ